MTVIDNSLPNIDSQQFAPPTLDKMPLPTNAAPVKIRGASSQQNKSVNASTNAVYNEVQHGII